MHGGGGFGGHGSIGGHHGPYGGDGTSGFVWTPGRGRRSATSKAGAPLVTLFLVLVALLIVSLIVF